MNIAPIVLNENGIPEMVKVVTYNDGGTVLTAQTKSGIYENPKLIYPTEQYVKLLGENQKDLTEINQKTKEVLGENFKFQLILDYYVCAVVLTDEFAGKYFAEKDEKTIETIKILQKIGIDTKAHYVKELDLNYIIIPN